MTIDLSHKIGMIFYAIAKADGKLTYEEYCRFIDDTEKNWKDLSYINYNNIKTTFNDLQAQNADSNKCYNDFIYFLRNNPEIFTKDLKRLILKTANKIAHSFAGINKSELILLAKLNLEFKKH
ncbi:MAG: hypothetical protein HKP48_07220 [Winogradskyella sp.]|uniref:hypothetical protein n=1 Tax=Winogradskyella sp. TaxID=1883156 RepID=UPI00179A526C|nr:hypothetical protein [Winogradskyella sp.]MBT8245855.1 hypothetical protein [Winogradskyella sp.]NNK23074.1 hypothetical protein [Winogradskyella sp.]